MSEAAVMLPFLHTGAPPSVKGSRRHRRFSHLTPEDVALLDHLAETCGNAAARVFERMIRSQFKGDCAFEDNVTLEGQVGSIGVLEGIHGQRAARWLRGTGGGRRAQTDDPRARA